MRRREFIQLVSGAATTWPLSARAQQASRLPTIGLLAASTPDMEGQWIVVFAQRLRELGWIEGRTVAIEYRWGEGRTERFAEFAAEFVRLKVDVIVTHGVGVPAAKQATATIPIVFALAGDPVGRGFVSSLARPGGNITGLSMQAIDTAGKRLELLREIMPGFKRLAVLANLGFPGSTPEIDQVRSAAQTLGMEVGIFDVRQPKDIVPAFSTLTGNADALYVVSDPVMDIIMTRINILAAGARLPTMHLFREHVAAGGLMSYGPNIPDLWRRTAEFVDKILRGTKPADIPVEQPTKFDLIVNLTTAHAFGIAIPSSLLAHADEVIE
jgi:putative tryptophan/tyrosine transport system substrate-binding protein